EVGRLDGKEPVLDDPVDAGADDRDMLGGGDLDGVAAAVESVVDAALEDLYVLGSFDAPAEVAVGAGIVALERDVLRLEDPEVPDSVADGVVVDQDGSGGAFDDDPVLADA